MELPPWMGALREAMSGAIAPDDVKEVMAAQVRKAREGDRKAADFVMNQAHKLMASQAKLQRPVTIVQNNYYDVPADERPGAPIQPGDDGGEGDRKDLRKLRNRARALLPVTGVPGDARVRAVGDEEEKELRRREDERARAAADDVGPEGD